MKITKYSSIVKINNNEPPNDLKLEDLQKIIFKNEAYMLNHSQEIVTDIKKLWNLYKLICYPE